MPLVNTLSGTTESDHDLIEVGQGRKRVVPSQPYAPQKNRALQGRAEEMKMITAAWMRGADHLPLSPILLGPPGVGKNHLVYQMARDTCRDLYIFQGHEDVTAEDLACAVRFSDSDRSRMEYVASPLVMAMHKGGICFIDEIAKIRPRALALLVSVLDDRRYIDSALLGTRVYAHEGFRFIAATNTADLDGNAMPEFLLSRLRPVIKVNPAPREQLDEIILNRHLRMAMQIRPRLDQFWDLWSHFDGRRKEIEKGPPSPRDIIHVFDLAVSLADYDLLSPRGVVNHLQELPAEVAAITEDHLKMAFDELFAAGNRSSS